MAEKIYVTITKITQGRTRKGEKPEAKVEQVFNHEISPEQIPAIVALAYPPYQLVPQPAKPEEPR